jgi:integral membrane sensor domain MASE1
VNEQATKWRDGLFIASPAIPLVGMGLIKVQRENESRAALIPFLLVAALAVVVLLSVYAARDRSFQTSASHYWPRTRAGTWLYVAVLFCFPLTLVIAAAISIAADQWLAAGILLALAVTPTMLRVAALREIRKTRPSANF